MSSEANTDNKKLIAAQLINSGWVTVSDFDFTGTYAVATKDFETKVGVKTASAALEPYGDGGDQILVGHYYSEGRNVLSTTWVLIPKGVSAEALAVAADAFISEVDQVVGESYAMRLTKSFGGSGMRPG